MALSVYGTQFRTIPAGETVTFVHQSVNNTIPVNIQYVQAIVDYGASTASVISGVTMSNTSCVITNAMTKEYTVTFTLSGKYGDDLATLDVYQACNQNVYDPDASSFYGSDSKPSGDFKVTTYNSYGALMAAKASSHSSTTGWNHIVKFYPDTSSEKTVTYKFTVSGVTNVTNTQKVHLIPTRHFTRLNSLMNSIYAAENPTSTTRTMSDSGGNSTTPSYSSNPAGWVDPAE